MPLGNELFAELVDAIFKLEEAVSKKGIKQLRANNAIVASSSSVSQRPVSSHCAVNRNAEFMPHVDSGRGAGRPTYRFQRLLYSLAQPFKGAYTLESPITS